MAGSSVLSVALDDDLTAAGKERRIVDAGRAFWHVAAVEARGVTFDLRFGPSGEWVPWSHGMTWTEERCNPERGGLYVRFPSQAGKVARLYVALGDGSGAVSGGGA